MDVIAAIPELYKSKLIPYLRVKPVRTASGVAVVVCVPLSSSLPGRHVQATPLSSHCLYWKCLRVWRSASCHLLATAPEVRTVTSSTAPSPTPAMSLPRMLYPCARLDLECAPFEDDTTPTSKLARVSSS